MSITLFGGGGLKFVIHEVFKGPKNQFQIPDILRWNHNIGSDTKLNDSDLSLHCIYAVIGVKMRDLGTFERRRESRT